MDLARTASLAGTYSAQVRHGGGGGKRRARTSFTRQQVLAATLTMQRICRGHCARCYAWGLRWLAQPQNVRAVFDRFDRDGSGTSRLFARLA